MKTSCTGGEHGTDESTGLYSAAGFGCYRWNSSTVNYCSSSGLP